MAGNGYQMTRLKEKIKLGCLRQIKINLLNEPIFNNRFHRTRVSIPIYVELVTRSVPKQTDLVERILE